jgi:ribosomal-protein-alanine N-acetyltransferase
LKLDHQSPSAAHWSEYLYRRLFDGPNGDPTYFAFIAEDETGAEANDQEKTPAGFLVAHRVEVEWELQNIVVAARFHRRGIASLLIAELVRQARAHHASTIFLEVRQSNAPARALYKSLGFEEHGLRKGYYQNPFEDAILCRLSLY